MKTLSGLLLEGMKKGLIFFMIGGISVLNMPQVSLAASTNEYPGPLAEVIWLQPEPVATDNNVRSTVFEPTGPIVVRSASVAEEEALMDDMTMLFVAGGAVVLGAAVLIGNNFGGSDSDESGSDVSVAPVEPEPEPEPTTPSLVGPDMNGDWIGYLELKDKGHEGYQGVTASILHKGGSIKIATSSTLDYGRYFNGTISGSGYMYMYESVTGEVWTTHKGNASSRTIDLYDYVNNFTEYDRMVLKK